MLIPGANEITEGKTFHYVTFLQTNKISSCSSSLRGHFVRVSLGGAMLLQFSLDSEFEARA